MCSPQSSTKSTDRLRLARLAIYIDSHVRLFSKGKNNRFTQIFKCIQIKIFLKSAALIASVRIYWLQASGALSPLRVGFDPPLLSIEQIDKSNWQIRPANHTGKLYRHFSPFSSPSLHTSQFTAYLLGWFKM